MNQIGKRVELLRKKKGYSLRKLGEVCNLSHTYINDIEKSRSNPSLQTLKILADNLDTSISYLVGEESREKNLLNIINNNENLKSIIIEMKDASDKEIELFLKTWKYINSVYNEDNNQK